MVKRVKNPKRTEPMDRQMLKAKFDPVFKNIPSPFFDSPNSPTNSFGVLVKNEKIAKLFIPYWSGSKTLLSISFRESELIILKSAVYFGCDYVWGHHVLLGQQSGLSNEEIAEILKPAEECQLCEKEKVLLCSVEALYRRGNLNDEEFKKLSSHYRDEEIVDIITVISQYMFFNCINNTFGVELENETMPPLPD